MTTPEKHLFHGDMLEVLPLLSELNFCVDFVFADLPYGKTDNKWDTKIDLCKMWLLLPDCCTCVFTASSGFEYTLFNSNPTQYNYKWIWNKNNSAGFANAKRRPLNVTEDILVFRSDGRYFPIMETRGKERVKGGYSASTNYNKESRLNLLDPTISVNNTYYPKSIINIPKNNSKGSRHPTQKPVELLEYLIQTYTLPGETVLDPCMGSGSTGEACFNLGRSFIGIEKDDEIFADTEMYLENVWTAVQDG